MLYTHCLAYPCQLSTNSSHFKEEINKSWSDGSVVKCLADNCEDLGFTLPQVRLKKSKVSHTFVIPVPWKRTLEAGTYWPGSLVYLVSLWTVRDPVSKDKEDRICE